MFGDVASANVVGYNQRTSDETGLPEYFVPSFDGVGASGTYTLSQVTPVGTDWDAGMSDYLATVDPYGSQDTFYTYVEGHWYIADGSGWYDDSQVMDDVVLNTNQGLLTQSWMYSPFQFAGEVQKGEAELYLYDGLPAYTGNFTAADLTLGDFVPGGDWDAGMSDYVATIDPYGSQDVFYTYVDGNWYVADGSGWYDDSEIMNDVDIPANKGLLIQTWIDTSTVNIPMPIAE